MKRLIGNLFLVALFLGATVGTVGVSVNTVSDFAREKNQEKTAVVQQRLDETFSLLETLSEDEYIRDKTVSYLDKAAFLTNKNQSENLGYMMLRILDEKVNIYKEGLDGPASSLVSRDYMQRLYSIGEKQITDAFLAGADGTTLNYTATVAIKEDNQVIGSLMAAIYGSEMDEYLKDDDSVNVLVGSQLQYMGGISDEQFGTAVAQALENELKTSRPVEIILLDFQGQKGGSFWGVGNGLECFVYAPVNQSDWIVMTQVHALPLVKNILTAYIVGVIVLVAVAVVWNRKSNPNQ